MSTKNILTLCLFVASWFLMATDWWDRNIEERSDGWLRRHFGESAPFWLAMAVLAVSLPLGLYWWVSDFRRLWGL